MSMTSQFDLISVGGGAAGFFGSLAAKDANPKAKVLLLERSSSLLGKVRISGGGRCNVTHSCFDPKSLVKNYPRGHKELIGPFTRFQPQDTIEWFKSRGVELKTETDGRMFPITDNSQTIIDCLMNEAKKLKVEIRYNQQIIELEKKEDHFLLKMATGEVLATKSLLLATGSHPKGFQLAESLGHTIQSPVPSLFTFNVPTSPLKDLSGISLSDIEIQIKETNFSQKGPLLITHWGFSGPAALKLSAWAARYLYEKNYHVTLLINWIPQITREEIINYFKAQKLKHSTQTFQGLTPFNLPRNLWKKFLELSDVDGTKRPSDINNETLQRISEKLVLDAYQVEGKTTNKEEFVTCGGVTLSEVNFKTIESKLVPGLFFAGEVLDIDGITGGFNFQNAWTTSWIAGHAAVK